jgi:glucose/arabinose dehydrogenase
MGHIHTQEEFMKSRLFKLLAAGAALSAVGAAQASAAAPPTPVSTTGKTISLFASGLTTPTSFAFGGSTVFEGDGGAESGPPTGGVFALENGKGVRIPGSPSFVAGLAWHAGTLYVSGGNPTSATSGTFTISAYSAWNGTKFASQKVIYTAPKKFQGFNGIAYGPDGRLYVGVDVSLFQSNDHGPASKSPFLYELLSLKPNGKDLKVFAKGMRQPWQIAFAAGDKSPFVTDLGQDSGAKNPPDFLLHVKKGDNYGFPACNWTKPAACKKYTKPFKLFGHDPAVQGIAIVGKTIYLSEFSAGQVVALPLSGKGSPKVIAKGFGAPIVGLAASGGSLYVGRLTGDVFKIAL